MVKERFPYGAVELGHSENRSFKVNGQRLKLYKVMGMKGKDGRCSSFNHLNCEL